MGVVASTASSAIATTTSATAASLAVGAIVTSVAVLAVTVPLAVAYKNPTMDDDINNLKSISDLQSAELKTMKAEIEEIQQRLDNLGPPEKGQLAVLSHVATTMAELPAPQRVSQVTFTNPSNGVTIDSIEAFDENWSQLTVTATVNGSPITLPYSTSPSETVIMQMVTTTTPIILQLGRGGTLASWLTGRVVIEQASGATKQIPISVTDYRVSENVFSFSLNKFRVVAS